MLSFRINVSKRLVIPQFVRPGQLHLVGERVAIPSMLARIDKGLDVADQPAKRLSAPYIKAKARAGKSGIPDLRYSGALLRDLGVLSVEDMRLKIGFQSQLQIIKAIANQARRRQIGLSPADQAAVQSALDEMVRWNILESRRTERRAA